MSTKFFALLTNIGAARLANATALGLRLDITHMAIGDGGGVLPTPNPAQTKLINETRRTAINSLSVDPNNTNQIIAEQVIPESEGGFWIRELGLFDAEGNLIAVANCAETYKPQLQEGSGRIQTVRMILIVSSTDTVSLKIDPAVVLATRGYVDDAIATHEKGRKHPDATLEAKGFVQLNNATDSNSETQAATPKAVKAVNDNANTRLLSTGTAAAAKKLATARAINGVPFDGSVDIGVNTLVSRGRVPALSGNDQGTTGIQLYEAYNNGYPTPYGNVIHLKGASTGGEGELLIGWSGNSISGAHAPLYIRSRRDVGNAPWSAWAQVFTASDIQAYTETELDRRYQPKGAGQSYTKAESDARYVRDVKRGSVSAIYTPESTATDAPKGCVMVGVTLSNDGSTGTHINQIRYCPLQIKINGAWRTVSDISDAK